MDGGEEGVIVLRQLDELYAQERRMREIVKTQVTSRARKRRSTIAPLTCPDH